jgi:hypothetical protein
MEIKKSLDDRAFELNYLTTENQIENQGQWIDIVDLESGLKILESYGDEQKRLILESVVNESHTLSEILEICKIPHTSFHRKFNSLIHTGLLVENSVVIKDTRRIKKYQTTFENLKINIFRNRIIVMCKPQDFLQNVHKFNGLSQISNIETKN